MKRAVECNQLIKVIGSNQGDKTVNKGVQLKRGIYSPSGYLHIDFGDCVHVEIDQKKGNSVSTRDAC